MYSCDDKAESSASLLQSENSCAALYFCRDCDTITTTEQKPKKCNCDFLSHRSAFFLKSASHKLTILTFFLQFWHIFWHKLTIMSHKVQFKGKKYYFLTTANLYPTILEKSQNCKVAVTSFNFYSVVETISITIEYVLSELNNYFFKY